MSLISSIKVPIENLTFVEDGWKIKKFLEPSIICTLVRKFKETFVIIDLSR